MLKFIAINISTLQLTDLLYWFVLVVQIYINGRNPLFKVTSNKIFFLLKKNPKVRDSVVQGPKFYHFGVLPSLVCWLSPQTCFSYGHKIVTAVQVITSDMSTCRKKTDLFLYLSSYVSLLSENIFTRSLPADVLSSLIDHNCVICSCLHQ